MYLGEETELLAAVEMLLSWEGRMVRSALLLVGGSRFQMQTFEAFQPALHVRWRGRLQHVICRPSLDACRQFDLRPQRLRLIFAGGPRIEVAIEHVYQSARRGARLALMVSKDLRLVIEPLRL